MAGAKFTSQLQQGSLEEPQAACPLDRIFERSSEFSSHPPLLRKVQYRIHIDYNTQYWLLGLQELWFSYPSIGNLLDYDVPGRRFTMHGQLLLANVW